MLQNYILIAVSQTRQIGIWRKSQKWSRKAWECFGWGWEQPGQVEGVPALGRGAGMRWATRSLPTKPVCDSMNAAIDTLRKYFL